MAGSDRCGRREYRPHPAPVGSTQIPPPPPGGDAVIGRGHRGRQLDSGPPSRASPARDPWDLSDPAPAGQWWEDDSVGQVEGRVSEQARRTVLVGSLRPPGQARRPRQGPGQGLSERPRGRESVGTGSKGQQAALGGGTCLPGRCRGPAGGPRGQFSTPGRPGGWQIC